MEQKNLNPETKLQNAPYSVAALVLGILSLVSGCFGAGLILGIVGTVLGVKGSNAYDANPSIYNGKGMLTAGKVMSIIGIVFGALSLVWIIIAGIAGMAYFDWLLDIFDFLDF